MRVQRPKVEQVTIDLTEHINIHSKLLWGLLTQKQWNIPFVHVYYSNR